MLRSGFGLLIALSMSMSMLASGAEPLLRPGDTLALIGGTLIERMQHTAALEDQLHLRRPDWNLRVRNLGWSGDDVHGFARKVFETDPHRGFERLLSDLRIVKPTVALVAYGFAEASSGSAATANFESGLRKLVAALEELNCRVVLLRPFVIPGVKLDGYAERIATCARVVDAVGKEIGAAVLNVRCDHWSEDGMIPTATGYESIGRQLAVALVGGQAVNNKDAELDRLIIEKNQQFFHRYRPQNETYLMLFRKHEQGNNAVELPQFDPIVDALDARIWDQAANPK